MGIGGADDQPLPLSFLELPLSIVLTSLNQRLPPALHCNASDPVFFSLQGLLISQEVIPSLHQLSFSI
jgi:hypothetical protein